MISDRYHNEQVLIADLHHGSEEAFTYIYSQYKKQVFFYAKRFVTRVSDAEDLAADAFIKLWQRREHFESKDAIGAFLHVTIRNNCLNFLRHSGVRRDHEQNILRLLKQQEQEENFLIEKVRIELINIIYEEVEKLPPKMKEIFLLSYKEGLKPAEIAERLRINVQTVKNQRVTAIRLLREALRNYPAAIALLLNMEIEATTHMLSHH